jgi:hypothetical protein
LTDSRANAELRLGEDACAFRRAIGASIYHHLFGACRNLITTRNSIISNFIRWCFARVLSSFPVRLIICQ